MDVVAKLTSMGIDLTSELVSIIMLYSFPSSCDNFRNVVELRDQLPSPEDLKIKIIEESETRRNTSTNAEITNKGEGAFYLKNKIPYCRKCRKKGTSTEKCCSRFRPNKRDK